MIKYAILGYNTINIGDDIQSFITSTLINVSYIIMRDDYDKIYDFDSGSPCELNDEKVYLIMNGWFMHNNEWRTGNSCKSDFIRRDNSTSKRENSNVAKDHRTCYT